MKAYSFLIGLAVVSACKAVTPQLQFAWNEIDYTWATPADRENAIKDGIFKPENNIPVGVARWKNKLFVTVPRWKDGVASTLNYIDVDGAQDQLLKPYPSFKDNLIADNAKEIPSNSSTISVFRIYIDPCDRLWVVDTGKANMLGTKNQIVGPSLLIFDLKTDQLIRRYSFKEKTDVKENSFFGNIVVDVDKDKCDDAYAYIADLGGFGLVVYNFKEDDSWRVSHHYFFFDPLAGAFNVSGMEVYWADGVLGLTLSEPEENGYRTLYFHALSSTMEFYVSTELLQNYRHVDAKKTFHDFKLLGEGGEKTQSTTSAYDAKTHVIFYTQVARDGVSCWNSKKPYTSANNPLLFSDPVLYDFPMDLKFDSERNLWLVTDRLPRFMYQSLDKNEVNHRIFTIDVDDAIAGTTCE